MNPKTAKTTINTLQLCGLLIFMTACSSSSDNGPDCRFNEAWLNGECSVDILPTVQPSGIWSGTDSSGGDVLILVAAGGAFHYVDATANQGAGFFAPEASITSGFDLVTPLDRPFSDGATLASCSFNGSLSERRQMQLTQSCVTSAGTGFSDVLDLRFNPLYDRESSLAAISGNYEAASGSVLSVAADGELFMQDAANGCVTNGRFAVITRVSNLYDVSLQFDSCSGPDAVLNGSAFSGLAFLDDTAAVESLVIAVIGDVAGTPVSAVERATRL